MKAKDYELIYEGKEKEEEILINTPTVSPRKIKSFIKNAKLTDYYDRWENMLIFGDNLAVFKTLMNKPDVKGRVKLVYIDPPPFQQTMNSEVEVHGFQL